MRYFEANFDGLVGPTHNYAGLSYGNVASKSNAQAVSNPKQAALQGLAKMKALHDMGMKQGILAPQERPDVHTLRRIGFSGSDEKVIQEAYAQAPHVFLATCSASSMWTANAATVSPSPDTRDHKVHFTPANLTNKFHRSIEPAVTGRVLKAIFTSESHFVHHPHLPENDHFGDEGAANHTRFCEQYGKAGLELFVFGKYAFDERQPAPIKFPARQTFEASDAIARSHQLGEQNKVFAQQNPDVIDQGVFHNDVIAVGNKNVLFYHEQAFLNTELLKQQILEKYQGDAFYFIEVPSEQVSVEDAVKSYLFNTQLVNVDEDKMIIIAPQECAEIKSVNEYLKTLVNMSNPISDVQYFDVKQSMQNGGGPACLRLRVALSEEEIRATNPACFMSDEKYSQLVNWVNKHYRDRLTSDDLATVELLNESRTALDELTQILNLGSVYPFQRNG